MKIWPLLRTYALGNLLSLLILTTGNMASAQDRMDAVLAHGAHHMSMTEPLMAASDVMPQGPADAACQIICLGTTLAEPQAMPMMGARSAENALCAKPSPHLA